MKNLFVLNLTICALLFVCIALPAQGASWWDVQVIDTMKYSRDLSREKLHNKEFDVVIARQMKDIAETGATHVAIATPYDEVFFPILKRWVAAARAEGLKVWFRGNWSGWEQWFDFPPISRAQHIQKTKEFLSIHQDIFEDGDIFSACPECENGGPGDPRTTGDVEGYRSFIIDEYKMTKAAFHSMGKQVASNWQSMNADVARLIMDPATTQAMGGLVVIDHYVSSPKQLAADIEDIAAASGGKVALGEFGAPIPDLHGTFSEKQQVAWLTALFDELVDSPSLVGLSYWVNIGGSTQLWDDDLSPRLAVETVTSYYTPKTFKGSVLGVWGKALAGVQVISAEGKVATTDSEGTFSLPYRKMPIEVEFTIDGYEEKGQIFEADDMTVPVTVRLEKKSFFRSFTRFFCKLFEICTSA